MCIRDRERWTPSSMSRPSTNGTTTNASRITAAIRRPGDPGASSPPTAGGDPPHSAPAPAPRARRPLAGPEAPCAPSPPAAGGGLTPGSPGRRIAAVILDAFVVVPFVLGLDMLLGVHLS